MVPLNPHYRGEDAGHILEHSRAAAVVTSDDLARHVREALGSAHLDVPLLQVEQLPGAGSTARGVPPRRLSDRVAAEDTVNIQYTSGTTGRPKGCVLSHRYWIEIGSGLVDGFPHLSAEDTMLTAQAFSYIDPQWNLVAALLAGAHLVVLDAFHPSTFWSKVREHEVTYFYCLAAMPTLMLKMHPDPLDRSHRVRVVQCSAIPPAHHEELEQRWGVKWYEAFGMTETGADLRVTDVDHDHLVGSGCVGAAARAREVRIVDAHDLPVPRGEVGELVLRGPGLMDRYEADPEATAAAFRGGWFHTGDLGRMDEAGRVYLVGRLKDMVRRAGENVSAREVEDVLLAHPAVRLAAVVAVPDELRGEEVKAFVSPTGADALGAGSRVRTRRRIAGSGWPASRCPATGRCATTCRSRRRTVWPRPAWRRCPAGRGTEWMGCGDDGSGTGLFPVRQRGLLRRDGPAGGHAQLPVRGARRAGPVGPLRSSSGTAGPTCPSGTRTSVTWSAPPPWSSPRRCPPRA